MANSFLYENMQMLHDLSIRLKTKTYSDSDISFLAESLKSICDGVSPEKTFDIEQGAGETRADFRKHQRNVSAVKQIAAHTDALEASIDENGNLVVYEVPENNIPKTWKVIARVAKTVGIDVGTLKQYWRDKRYKDYKNPEA